MNPNLPSIIRAYFMCLSPYYGENYRDNEEMLLGRDICTFRNAIYVSLIIFLIGMLIQSWTLVIFSCLFGGIIGHRLFNISTYIAVRLRDPKKSE